MSLEQWLKNSWIREHKTSKQEIKNLFSIVDRDIKECQKGLSSDWKFSVAYNAALKLCMVLLYANGYKAERNLNHYRTIQSLKIILGNSRKNDTIYLDSCRKKRNISEYEYAGITTEIDADDLFQFVLELKNSVIDWLKENHPEFL